MISFLYKIYTFFITPIRSSKCINFLLFGFYPKNKKYGNFWDWTSIEVKKGIKKYFKSNMSFLDMGTGPYGVLSIYVKRRLKGQLVIGCDYCEDLVNNAIEQSSKDNISFIKSDLFENIKGKYDCIVFNAPYIKKDFGIKIGILEDDLSIYRWSGGDRGTITIEKFIENISLYLTENGVCLLGVNHFYVEKEIICNIINNIDEIQLIDYYKNRITKAGVYIIKKVK